MTFLPAACPNYQSETFHHGLATRRMHRSSRGQTRSGPSAHGTPRTTDSLDVPPGVLAATLRFPRLSLRVPEHPPVEEEAAFPTDSPKPISLELPATCASHRTTA